MKTRKGPKGSIPPGPQQRFAAKEKESCEKQEHRHTPVRQQTSTRHYQKVATVCEKAGKTANRKRRRERQNKIFPQEPTERQIPLAQTRKTQGATAPEPSPRKKTTCRLPELLFEKKKLQRSVLTTHKG